MIVKCGRVSATLCAANGTAYRNVGDELVAHFGCERCAGILDAFKIAEGTESCFRLANFFDYLWSEKGALRFSAVEDVENRFGGWWCRWADDYGRVEEGSKRKC